MKRGFVLCLCALAMSASSAGLASAQTVVLSLDLYYENPDSPGTSGGAWQLLATASNEGLAGLTTTLDFASAPSTTEADLIFMANVGLTPTAEYFKRLFDAKTWFTDTDADATTLNLVFGQVPVAAPGPQTLAYDAGGSATVNPDELRTAVDLTGAAMTNAVLLGLGRFSAGNAPTILAGSTQANVFSMQGTPTNPPAVGDIDLATTTTQVRDNENTLTGDANLDKITRGADLLILLPGLTVPAPTLATAQNAKTWQQGDFNGDHLVRGADLLLLLPKLTAPAHPAAAAAGIVPEPASCGLAMVACMGLASLARRYRQG